MKKLLFLGIMLFIGVQPFISPQTINYWTLNVDDDDYQGNASQKAAYFFKDLASMEALTGFPQGDFKTKYNWIQPLSGIHSYIFEIFAKLTKENFQTSFIQWGSGTNRYGELYWMYHVFLLWNCVIYMDDITRTNRPVSF